MGKTQRPLTWKRNAPEWVLLQNAHDTRLMECTGYVRPLHRRMEGFCYKCGWKLEGCTDLNDARDLLVDHMVDHHGLREPTSKPWENRIREADASLGT